MTSALALQAIRDAESCVAAVVSGGGQSALRWLADLEPQVPSIELRQLPDDQSVARYLGGAPEQYCSDRTARAMAMRSFSAATTRITACGKDLDHLVAVAVMARPAVDSAPSRAYVAIQTSKLTEWTAMDCSGDGADLRLSELVVDRIAAAVGPDRSPEFSANRSTAAPARSDLLTGRTLAIPPSGTTGSPALILPGAFDPIHSGHWGMAKHAAGRCGEEVHFELSIVNVDKPPLDFLEMERRISQFATGHPVWLTRAPTFAQKSRLFPGATFLVGADTLVRLDHARYYDDSVSARDEALEQIRFHGCRFLVFGRLSGSRFETGHSVPVSAGLRSLCITVDAHEFREDISSTQLRRKH